MLSVLVTFLMLIAVATVERPATASQVDSLAPAHLTGFATTVLDQGRTGVFGADVFITLSPAEASDSNPFHLAISPVSTATRAGGVAIDSASETGKLGGVVQHWALSIDSALRLAGELTGAANPDNTVTVPGADDDVQLLPMTPGTSLTGEFGIDSLTLMIEGTIEGAEHAFVTTIEATSSEPQSTPVSPSGQRGIINTDRVLMFERPDPLSPVVATLLAGTLVTITGPSVAVFPTGTYLPVTLADGRTGWVGEPFIDRVGAPNSLPDGEPGVITFDGAPLLGTPSIHGAVIATLDAGTPVVITGPAVEEAIGEAVYLPVTLEMARRAGSITCSLARPDCGS